jgi:ABC-type sugar transport system permease subunit
VGRDCAAQGLPGQPWRPAISQSTRRAPRRRARRRGPRGLRLPRRAFTYVGGWKSDAAARWTFIWPSVIVVLFLSIFPLFASLTLAFGKLVFQKGKVDVSFVGFSNFTNLLFGTERTHLLGLARTPTPLGWLVLIVVAVLLVRALIGSLRSGRVGVRGAIARVAGALFGIGLTWLIAQTMLSEGGRPGSLVVTLFYVFAGIAVTYGLGLGLAILAVQPLPGRRFFRIVFLLPLTITPIGVGYMFRMMTDTGKGPLAPLFGALGRRATRGSRIRGRPGSRSSSAMPGSGRRSCSSSCSPRSRGSTRRSARRRSSTAPRNGDVPPHHVAGDPAGQRDDRAHPDDRGLQDRRHAEHPDRRRPGHRDPVADARRLPQLAGR